MTPALPLAELHRSKGLDTMLNNGQFRFSFFTHDYEGSVAFYRDALEFPVLESWNRNPDDRGILFGAASGIIEVLAYPRNGRGSHLFDDRSPQGAFMVIDRKSVV